MKLALKFSERDWQNLSQNWMAWWTGQLERPLVMIESPLRSRTANELTIHFLRDQPVDSLLDFYNVRLSNTILYGDAFPKWFPFFGAGLAAAFLGSELLCTPEEGTIWFEPSQTLESYDLSALYDRDNIWLQRIQQLTQAAVDRWQDRVRVGFTDLGGNLDLLASLRSSQALLVDLMDKSEQVSIASKQITRQLGGKGFAFYITDRLSSQAAQSLLSELT